MTNRFLPRLRAAFCAALLCSLLHAAQAGQDAPFVLTVVHVNDTHSQAAGSTLRGAPCYEDEACFGGYARIAAFIESERARAPHVLALDAGDAWQGSLFFSTGHDDFAGAVEAAMGYDAVTLGNHELDLGCEAASRYVSRLTNAGVAVLSANLVRESACALARAPIAPYVVRDAGGVRVGIIGLSNDEVREISKACPETDFKERKKALEEAVAALQSQGVHRIIALTHLGYDTDQKLAREVSGVDLYVGGHTHSVLGSHPGSEGPYPTVVVSPDGSRSLIVQAGLGARHAGSISIAFDEQGRVSAYAGELRLLTPEMPRAPRLEALVKKQSAVIAASLNTPVAKTTGMGPDGLDYCREAECPAGMLSADAYLSFGRRFGAVAAILNSGSIRAALPEGTVTRASLMDIHPFANRLAVVDLSGRTLRLALEHGLTDPDVAGPRLLQVAGLRYAVNAKAPVGSRLGEVQMRTPQGGWEALDDDKTYRIVMNAYLADGGDKFTMLQDAARSADDHAREEDMTDLAAVLEYVQEIAAQHQGTIPAPEGGRIAGLKGVRFQSQ